MSHAEDAVRERFAAYERALVANDVEALDAFFLRDAHTSRFGVSDRQYGFDQITAWRWSATPVPSDRVVHEVRMYTVSDTAVVITCEFTQAGGREHGRQSQVWALVDGAWRIVHAHVSLPR